ncbi:MAG TPA: hydantoinase/oxoprolinase family protein [Steroidobacter sp.]|uniref:hydantoinase/oxoprolinase family protein n=1 Tax=Steroidobacter sp. TaxID=1978227 RepID=UPI002EDAFC36
MIDRRFWESLRDQASGGVATEVADGSGKLINIDNGGTLTDICVMEGASVWRTKTLTTPYDLSKCLLDGLRKVSRSIYGQEDLPRLLRSTEYIRYSTTQGTNALVERKGPRLGLILGGGLKPQSLQMTPQARELFNDLVGDRVIDLDAASREAGDADVAVVRAVTTLTSSGANRLVIAFAGQERNDRESALKRTLLRKFPPHMLGAVPILYSHELVEDDDDARRTWTALFNAFLHPAMERFLYSAEHKLRAYHIRNPLLIFRNDGHSARVAKTIAMKTYSSGPRGGAEGARALAQHYAFKHLVSMDIGGTTTDIGEVTQVDGRCEVRARRRGEVEGVETSFPLCDVVSVGVGGSSIITVDAAGVKVGPESVGGAPGPACFGLGGKEATITDAFLSTGLLDSASYFGGELPIDPERARRAIAERVAGPLAVSEEQAALAMEQAWVAKIAASLKSFTPLTPETTLAAFGGAGPFVVCKVAEAAGISRVIIPGLAAVFSAFGVGFSDIAHQYEAPLSSLDADEFERCYASLIERARRGMAAENAELDQCRVSVTLRSTSDGEERLIPLQEPKLPPGLSAKARHSLAIEAVKPIAHATLNGYFGKSRVRAVSHAVRKVRFEDGWRDVPLYRVKEQPSGACADGPAVLEEEFFTCRIERNWGFEINAAGDVLLSRAVR